MRLVLIEEFSSPSDGWIRLSDPSIQIVFSKRLFLLHHMPLSKDPIPISLITKDFISRSVASHQGQNDQISIRRVLLLIVDENEGRVGQSPLSDHDISRNINQKKPLLRSFRKVVRTTLPKTLEIIG
jgi:hypothetical protein